jgi:hypothetical protein
MELPLDLVFASGVDMTRRGRNWLLAIVVSLSIWLLVAGGLLSILR